MKPVEVRKPDAPKDSITPTDAQKAFLDPLIGKYVDKVRALAKAQQDLQDTATIIYEFSTGIVAQSRKGQWFAIQADLVIRRDHPMAKQLLNLVWPLEDK